MTYPVVIHKDRDSDFGITVPDLPGCFSAGRTMDEALAMAKEAIELHLEGLIEAGEPIPPPASVDAHSYDASYRGGTWAVVKVGSKALRLAAKRVNITIPQRVLEAVDRFARREGATRSGLLVKAVTTYMTDRSSVKRTVRAPRGARSSRVARRRRSA